MEGVSLQLGVQVLKCTSPYVIDGVVGQLIATTHVYVIFSANVESGLAEHGDWHSRVW
jgi:hypothetical protein